jgi:hypothetical protein
MSKDTWYGLSRDGEQRQIAHDALMRWALDHDAQFQVGWSHHFTDRAGTRLVRGDTPIATARAQGWNDLADLLAAAGFRDATPA